MGKLTIKLNSAGVRAMLKSPEMQAMLSERARQIADRAGSGYETDVYNTLLKAVSGG